MLSTNLDRTPAQRPARRRGIPPRYRRVTVRQTIALHRAGFILPMPVIELLQRLGRAVGAMRPVRLAAARCHARPSSTGAARRRTHQRVGNAAVDDPLPGMTGRGAA